MIVIGSIAYITFSTDKMKIFKNGYYISFCHETLQLLNAFRDIFEISKDLTAIKEVAKSNILTDIFICSQVWQWFYCKLSIHFCIAPLFTLDICSKCCCFYDCYLDPIVGPLFLLVLRFQIYSEQFTTQYFSGRVCLDFNRAWNRASLMFKDALQFPWRWFQFEFSNHCCLISCKPRIGLCWEKYISASFTDPDIWPI